MKVLVTTAAQMFRNNDGSIWVDSVYDYGYFKRYLAVFDKVRILTRIKDVKPTDTINKLRVDGPNIEVHALPFYRGPVQYFLNRHAIISGMKESLKGCDAIILRIPDQLSFDTLWVAKRRKIPCAIEVVSDSWDFFSRGTISTPFRTFLRILWHLQQKYACRIADGVAYVTRKYIQERYPSGVERGFTNRFEAHYTDIDIDKNWLYRPHNQTEFFTKTPNLVHVGGINNNAKGHRELLEALAILKKRGLLINLTFIGGGVLLSYFKRLCIELDLTKEVDFIGQIGDRRLIREYLIKSDLFVLPSRAEGLPRVLIEAMAVGLPCIASKVGGIPELLEEECTFSKRLDPIEIAEKISFMLNNKAMLKKESERNYLKAKQFELEVVSIRRTDFYSKLKKLATKDNN